MEFNFDNIEQEKKKKERKLTFHQKVISRILNGKKFLWVYQAKIFKRILEKYPDKDFWENIIFNVDITSFAFFDTFDGKKLLEKKYSEFHYKPVEYIEEENELNLTSKFGEDFKTKKKTNIRNFLNG